MLRTATGRVANLLNEATPTNRLPPELLARILNFAVNHGSEEHAKQIIPLTHVCRYWRTLLLSYPRMWSTICMKPGDLGIVSEWLARSQNSPLTVIAEFNDTYEHSSCRYQDSPTATLADTDDLEVCPRHEAVLSLDQLLPHRSRVSDLKILVHLSDPGWEDSDRDGEPILLHHEFFKGTLSNLQRLDFRAAHAEESRYTIPVPDTLFAGQLPRLKELRYLGVNGGLTMTAKNLTLCEIGSWSGSAGSAIVSPGELQTLFNNNKTVKSLKINDCDIFGRATTPVPLTDINFLKLYSLVGDDLQAILKCIHVPQFRSLNTLRLSLPFPDMQAVATDGSGHTFEFSQSIGDDPDFYPLQYLGVHVTTLRLGRGMTLQRLDEDEWSGLCAFFRSLDAVQVLESDGMTILAGNVLSRILSGSGVFPELRVIRVVVCWDGCERSLQLLAPLLRLRMEEGNPLTRVEPLFVKDGDGLGRAEWEKHYEAEGIRNLLSE